MGALAELAAGWSLIAAGVAESWRRPASRAGLLLAGAGAGWFFLEWNNPGLGSPAAFTFGLIVSALAAPLVAHAALAYPAGRLASRLDLGIVLFGYAGAGLVLGLLPALFFDPGRQGCGLCPANLVLVRSEPGLPRGTLGDDSLDYRLWLGQAVLLVLMAAGVASAWVRERRTRSAVVGLMIDASQAAPPGGLRDVLAEILGDTGLELGYLVGEPPRHVRADGRPTDMQPGQGQQVTPLVRGGQTVAMLRHRAGLLDNPGLSSEVAAAARLGMENERLQAEVLAQLEDLRAAQARIVAAGDAERRRLERDLHDGAQQQLVALSLALRLTRPQPGLAAAWLTGLICQADRELQLAIGELRELAHGIYPAVLADEGLAAAVEALTEASPVPVTIGQLTQQRLPPQAEAAGYFLIAEATHLTAQAGAKGVTVDTEHAGDRLIIAITGHGSSGHELAAGLCDAADRIGAVGGQLRVEDIAGDTITIRAEIPCGL